MLTKIRLKFFLIAIVVAVLSSGIVMAKGAIIATVNGDKITEQDLSAELALRAKQNPSFKINEESINLQLDTIIDRRILIQEAQRRKLAETDAFVDTIRNFWEQTLIKELMENLNAEFERTTLVSEDEIQAAYAKIKDASGKQPPLDEVRSAIRARIFRNKKAEAFDRWMDQQRQKAKVNIDDVAKTKLSY